MLWRVLVIWLSVAANVKCDWYDLDNEEYEDAHLLTLDLLEKYGYPAEEHEVTTKDGYILTLHRILKSDKNECIGTKKPPVLLQHGLLSSSRDFIATGPKLGLGYILSDECYDVWMPNFRGNTYSRRHKTLSPTFTPFWDFSWHEMGLYDLPAFIDYILQETESEKLFYIGHSQGSTAYFIMDSLLPEYSEKVIAMFALAPIAYLGNSNSQLLVLISQLEGLATLITTTLGNGEFVPNTKLISTVAGTFCSDSLALPQNICENVFWTIVGPDRSQMNSTQLPIFLGGFPAGSSTKQLLHYAQSIKNNHFRQYDYGMLLNMGKYKSISPPDYPLENAKSKYLLWHSNNDYFTADKDIAKLTSQLPNVLNVTRVPWEKFNHADYLIAIDVRTLVYNDILQHLRNLS